MAWSALPFRQPGQNTQKLYCKKMLEVAGGSPTHVSSTMYRTQT